jgi:hypothetical protein
MMEALEPEILESVIFLKRSAGRIKRRLWISERSRARSLLSDEEKLIVTGKAFSRRNWRISLYRAWVKVHILATGKSRHSAVPYCSALLNTLKPGHMWGHKPLVLIRESTELHTLEALYYFSTSRRT